MTLLQRVSAYLISIICLSLIGNGYLIDHYFTEEVEDAVYDQALELADRAASYLSNHMLEAVGQAQLIARAVPPSIFTDGEKNAATIQLLSLRSAFPEFDAGIAFISTDGSPLTTLLSTGNKPKTPFTPVTPLADFTSQTDVQFLSSSRISWFKQPVFGFIVPIEDRDTVAGYLVCFTYVDSLSTRLGFHSHVDHNQHITLIDDIGLLSGVQGVNDPAKNLTEDILFQMQNGSSGLLIDRKVYFDGVLAYQQIPDLNWRVVVFQSDASTRAAILQSRRVITSLALVTIFIAITGSVLLLRRSFRPLKWLEKEVTSFDIESSRTIELFKKDYPFSLKDDEVGRLTKSFAYLGRRLMASFSEATEKAKSWQETFNSVEDAIFILNQECRIEQMNSAACDLLSLTEDEARGELCCSLVHGYDSSRNGCVDCGYQPGKVRLQRDILNERFQGFFEVNVNPILIEDGEVIKSIHILRNLTKRKQAETQVEQLANFDVLTGLPKRSYFINQLMQQVVDAQEKGHKIALLSLDLDRFRDINDALGHAAGDLILKIVAERIEGTLAKIDLIGRHGGDEFLIAISEVKAATEVIVLAESLLAAVREPIDIEGQRISCTGSLGIAIFPKDDVDIDALLKHAEIAMYQAKEHGGDSHCFFSHEMNRLSMERLNMLINLRHALQKEEFVLYFQPQSELKSGNIVAVEALIRWYNPEMGMVSPVNFIPLLEETGLIIPLGEWILRTACQSIKSLHCQGYKDLRVAVNISPRQFLDPDLVATIKAILVEVDFPPDLLELEITESLMVEDIEGIICILKELKSMGIQVAMDDFGTGYSSLSNLKRLPLDRLKIDREFVKDVITDPNDASIVEVVIDIGHNLGLKVLAEGVETKEQLEFLHRRKCDEVQGYYLARPMSLSDLEKFMAEILFVS